ncbi:MAG: hypothetical protein H7A23_05795 [Leptospiraceae bacterium]|nr:hypothetical protein [Leptospiraceae bacterium]MCP5494051.1 hypothetical protein [Leptospiraceae bacterium]
MKYYNIIILLFFILNSCSFSLGFKFKGQCCGVRNLSTKKDKKRELQSNKKVSINYMPNQSEVSFQQSISPNYNWNNCNKNIQVGCLQHTNFSIHNCPAATNYDLNLNRLKFSGFPKTAYSEEILNLNGDLAPPISSPTEKYHRKVFSK